MSNPQAQPTPDKTTADITLDSPAPAYLFFTETRGQDLERKVTEAMERGWTPVGGVCRTPDSETEYTMYSLAMVKLAPRVVNAEVVVPEYIVLKFEALDTIQRHMNALAREGGFRLDCGNVGLTFDPKGTLIYTAVMVRRAQS